MIKDCDDDNPATKCQTLVCYINQLEAGGEILMTINYDLIMKEWERRNTKFITNVKLTVQPDGFQGNEVLKD